MRTLFFLCRRIARILAPIVAAIMIAIGAVGCDPVQAILLGDKAESDTDQDGDGVTGDEDCNDLDSSSYPGAEEICGDGVDNDCNSEVDDGCPAEDADGDGDDASVDCDDADASLNLADEDEDGFSTCDEDCDDADPSAYPGADEICDEIDNDCNVEVDEGVVPTWYYDQDGDGFGVDDDIAIECEPPASYVEQGEDCDDDDASIHPDADEDCDDVDQDCDGLSDEDEGLTSTFYVDVDADTYGDDELTEQACEAPTGYADRGGDCDDDDPAYNPGAEEIDCADPNDYNCDGSTGYTDADGDGVVACEECDDSEPTVYPDAPEFCDELDNDCDGDTDEDYDLDLDGFYDAMQCSFGDDCNDADASINPDADEYCDGIDENCNGTVDDDAIDASTWYPDLDADTFGDATASVGACDQPSGYVVDSSDCDDTDATINPAADEYCDSVDEDCDGEADNDAIDASTWYKDNDADGYGDPDSPEVVCTPEADFVSNSSDCDDFDASVNPAAAEACDEIDNDCDESTDEDFDADGDGSYDASSCSFGDDCDDADADINPAADELCNDSLDNDCDGDTDEADASDASTWYADTDSDGYGDPNTSVTSCYPGAPYVSEAGDCDDTDSTVGPDMAETCDGEDNDCDGEADNGLGTWSSFLDADGDGYGDESTEVVDCATPSGYITTGEDCDDTDSGVNPGAAETCDGIDEDCDGSVDDGLASETYYLDADGDGYGNDSSTTTACAVPSGYAEVGGDCDDDDATINPGADEEYGDAEDEDCDSIPEIWYIDGTTLCVSDLYYSCWATGSVYIIGESPFSWTSFDSSDELGYGDDVAGMWCWDVASTYPGTARNYEISFVSEYDIVDSTCATSVDASDRDTWYPASYEGIDDYCADYGSDDPEGLCHDSNLMPSLYGEVYSLRFYYDGASTMYGIGTP